MLVWMVLLVVAWEKAAMRSRSTTDHILTLQTLFEDAKENAMHDPSHRLIVAFVDFKKAYDLVDREVLWKCLGSLGVHGGMLYTLKT